MIAFRAVIDECRKEELGGRSFHDGEEKEAAEPMDAGSGTAALRLP
jgi:hypothetical protein